MSQIERRRFLVVASALAIAPLAYGQRAGEMHRVAFVVNVSPIREMQGPEPEHPKARI